MIGAILAAFTAAALMGKAEPMLLKPFNTVEECQVEASTPGLLEAARESNVVILCLQLRTGV